MIPFRVLVVILIGSGVVKAQTLVTPHEPTFMTLLKSGELPEYVKPTFGEWRVENGALIGDQVEADNHHPGMRIPVEMTDVAVLEFKFRFGSKPQTVLSIYGKGKRQFGFTPEICWVRIGSKEGSPAHVCAFDRVHLDPEKWHRVRIEIKQSKFLVTINNRHKIHGSDPAFLAEKTSLALGAGGDGGGFKAIKIWRGKPAVDWTDSVPICEHLSLEEFNFVKFDSNSDGQLSAKEFNTAYRDRKVEEEVEKAFVRFDRNGDQIISKDEFVRKKPGK